jgi:hypothetical protein
VKIKKQNAKTKVLMFLGVTSVTGVTATNSKGYTVTPIKKVSVTSVTNLNSVVLS